MRNIEKGCLAVIIKSYNEENIGKVVTVGNFLGKIPGYQSGHLWEIDKLILFTGMLNFVKQSFYVHYCSEKSMQRIDEDDLSIKNKEERLCNMVKDD